MIWECIEIRTEWCWTRNATHFEAIEVKSMEWTSLDLGQHGRHHTLHTHIWSFTNIFTYFHIETTNLRKYSLNFITWFWFDTLLPYTKIIFNWYAALITTSYSLDSVYTALSLVLIVLLGYSGLPFFFLSLFFLSLNAFAARTQYHGVVFFSTLLSYGPCVYKTNEGKYGVV